MVQQQTSSLSSPVDVKTAVEPRRRSLQRTNSSVIKMLKKTDAQGESSPVVNKKIVSKVESPTDVRDPDLSFPTPTSNDKQVRSFPTPTSNDKQVQELDTVDVSVELKKIAKQLARESSRSKDPLIQFSPVRSADSSKGQKDASIVPNSGGKKSSIQKKLTRRLSISRSTGTPSTSKPSLRRALSEKVNSHRGLIKSNFSRSPPKTDKKMKDAKENSMDQLLVPSLVPQKGFLTVNESLSMRSSEQEPSAHQVDISTVGDLTVHARLCALLELHKDLDLVSLANASRKEIQDSVNGSNLFHGGLTQQHESFLRSLHKISNDIIVEGFFRTGEESPDARTLEVTVFNCQSRRQIIVAYRSMLSLPKSKSISIRKTNQPRTVLLHQDQPVEIRTVFRDAYFHSPDLEERVFTLLDRLVEKHPFCDVVMTGHTFGAAMATIGAVRFANQREMIRVSCHIFGSVPVGCSEFRRLVNSTPNLKVFRVEHHSVERQTTTDNSVCDNSISSSPTHTPNSNEFTHVGHTIALQLEMHTPVVCYKFEKNKPANKNNIFLAGLSKITPPNLQKENGKTIGSYSSSLERVVAQNLPWPSDFVSVGEGIRGADNESRLVV